MSDASTTVLLVTRPVTPPWSDGTRNLVHALISHPDAGLRFRVPVPRGAPALDLPGVLEEPIYPEAGGHGTSARNNRAMLLRLLRPARARAMHFLFAPTPRTGGLLRKLLLPRRLPTIHTLCSRPRDFATLPASLFARHHVALSRDTEARLLEAGAPNVARVAPGVPEIRADPARGRAFLEQAGLPEGAPFLLYAGDLEHSRGAETVVRALPEGLGSAPHHAVLACREKTDQAGLERARLQALAETLGVADRCHFFAHVDRFHDLVAAAAALLFPTADTYAKLDLPLVLLEALALGVPLVVASAAPVGELLEDPVGLGVAGEDPADLAAALRGLTSGRAALPSPDSLRAIWRRRYSAAGHARAMIELYQEWIR